MACCATEGKPHKAREGIQQAKHEAATRQPAPRTQPANQLTNPTQPTVSPPCVHSLTLYSLHLGQRSIPPSHSSAGKQGLNLRLSLKDQRVLGSILDKKVAPGGAAGRL